MFIMLHSYPLLEISFICFQFILPDPALRIREFKDAGAGPQVQGEVKGTTIRKF